MELLKQIDLARLAKVSRQYINQLVDSGKFNLKEIAGVKFIIKDFKVDNFLKEHS